MRRYLYSAGALLVGSAVAEPSLSCKDFRHPRRELLLAHLEPLGAICDDLTGNIQGAQVKVIDGTWVANQSQLVFEQSENHHWPVSLRLVAHGNRCARCLPMRRCLDVLAVVALALLLLDFGAARVEYSRVVSDGPPPLPCGEWGDFRDGVDGLMVSRGAQHTLLSWLESLQSPRDECGCAKGIVVAPSAAMDRQRSDKGRL